MDFAYSQKVQDLQIQLQGFIDGQLMPRHQQWVRETRSGAVVVSFMEELKAAAKSQGLWNLFLPGLKDDEPGTRLSNLEYAPLAEMMGRLPWSSEVFNCSAPDTGNMELLHLFATPEQRQHWLEPLMNGDIRSAFAMTEPDVSSSDATNIQTTMQRDGDDYVINGRKWFISNAAHPNCELLIVMGKTDPQADTHKQQSMLLVPMDTEGVEVLRNISVMNHVSPEGHCEMVFRNVRVPASNILGEEGAGFLLAQARLGPGRIHHCMRSIGMTEVAFEMMVERAQERQTFGRPLHKHGAVSDWIARSRMEIDQARLLVLKTAWMIDNLGVRESLKEISMIKALIPLMHTTVLDRAMQTFGAMGISPDTPLADLWIAGRALRYADGPDEVHMRTIARLEIKQSQSTRGKTAAYFNDPI